MSVVETVTVTLEPFGATLPGEPHGIFHGLADATHDASGGTTSSLFAQTQDNILLCIRNFVYNNLAAVTAPQVDINLLGGLLTTQNQFLIQRQVVPAVSAIELLLLKSAPLYVWVDSAGGGVFLSVTLVNTNGDTDRSYVQGLYWRMDELRKDGVGPKLL